jgi:hypothetical protein
MDLGGMGSLTSEFHPLFCKHIHERYTYTLYNSWNIYILGLLASKNKNNHTTFFYIRNGLIIHMFEIFLHIDVF